MEGRKTLLTGVAASVTPFGQASAPLEASLAVRPEAHLQFDSTTLDAEGRQAWISSTHTNERAVHLEECTSVHTDGYHFCTTYTF